MTRIAQQHGYILLPVVLGITLVATIAFMINHENATNLKTLNNDFEAAQADYVVQAGMAHATWFVQRSGCAGDATMTAVPLGAHSYSATVTGGGGSNTAYDLSVDQDAWIRSDQVDTNNGGNADQHIRFESGNIEQALFRFDLSSLTPGARINSASAWFYVKGTGTHPEGSLTVHKVTADWTEVGATWANMNGNFETPVLGSIAAQSSGDVWVQVNLTAQVQAWVNGEPNYGIMLGSNAEGVHAQYISREGPSNQHPRLEVVAGNAPASPVTIQATGTHANGVTRTLTRSAVRVYQPPSSMSVKTSPSGRDAAVNAGRVNDNYGSSTFLSVSGAGGDDKRMLYWFDLSSVPPRSKVLAAMLELYLGWGGGSTAAEFTAYRMSEPWTEGTGDSWASGDGATWSTSDGSTSWNWLSNFDSGNPADTIPINPSFSGWHSWDVRSIAADWVSGDHPNHGIVIIGNDSANDAAFLSRENGDTTKHPKLTIEYACECGSACLAPQGSGRVLMVVINPTTLVPEDAYKKTLFESWGYTVSIISESANQASYDSAVANADVVFISETVNASQVGSKLVDATKGVVSQDGTYNGDLGIASGSTWPVDSAINVTDNSHYITLPFASGSLDIYSASMEGLAVSGTEAPGLQTLANWGGAGALVTLNQGAQMDGGGSAAGRRVMLPLGREANLNWNYLNNNGHMIVQRALQWGTGAGGCGAGNFRDQFDSPAFNNSDGSLGWAGDWIEYDDVGSDPTSGKAVITGGELRLNGTVSVVASFPSGDLIYYPSLIRGVDLSAHQSATLTFDFRTAAGVEAGEDSAVLEVSGDGGTNWTVLEDFIAVGPSASGSRSYDISAFIAADTQIRLRINAGYGGPDEYFYVDNVDIAASCDPPTTLTPLAHWRLDETTGTTAVDSEGGHDGTLTNGPTWGTGQLDGALNFDGSNDYITVPHDDTLSLTTFSISAWIRPTTLSGWQIVVNKGTTTSAVNYYLATNGDEIGLGFYNSGWVEFNTTSANLSTNQWYHVAATYDDSTREGNVYLDGTLVHTSTATKSPLPNNDALTIGRSGFGEYWPGMLDDVRIYDQKLGPSEIAELAATEPLGPIAHWKLDETSGTMAVDSEGGHTGTLTNGPSWDTGAIDGGLSFDGSNDYINVPHDDTLSLTGGMTFTAWANTLDTSGAYKAILAKDTPGNGQSNYWFGIWDDELVFGFWASGSFRTVKTSSSNLQSGTWYHLAASFDNASDVVRLYVDGIEVHVGAITYEPTTETADLWIAHSVDGEYWEGTLDDIRIYNTVLSEGEISDMVTAGGGGGPPPPPSCAATFGDDFETDDYTGSTGDAAWFGDWSEINDSGNPNNGDVQVSATSGNRVLLIGKSARGAQRITDLSAYASATLTLGYWRSGLDSADEYASVEISADGSNWTLLDQYLGPGSDATDAPPEVRSYDISGHLSATTHIRFLTSTSNSKFDRILFDDIEICASN
jgi:hypothetical protein